MRNGALLMMLVVPFFYYAAFYRRNDPLWAALAFVLASTLLAFCWWALRRSRSLRIGSPTQSRPMRGRDIRGLLAVTCLGWIFFGVVFGLAQGKVLPFVLSLLMAAAQAALGVYAHRREASDADVAS